MNTFFDCNGKVATVFEETATPEPARETPTPAVSREAAPNQSSPPGDAQRRRRRSGPKREEGFGDSFIRSCCESMQYQMRRTWPPVPRPDTNQATMIEIDRREGEILYCNCSHDGAHAWPDSLPIGPPD